MKILIRVGALLIALGAFVAAAAPSLLLGPAVAQDSSHLDLAFQLSRIATPISIAAVLIAMTVAALQWRSGVNILGKAILLIGVVVAGIATWASTTNISQQFFDPLANGGEYVPLAAAEHVADDELIMGVVLDGEPLIYPVAIIGYHHIVNERLKGEPFVVTY